MLLIGLPCNFCNNPTLPHCRDAGCSWSRCPRCNSYGIPGQNFVQWRKDDYLNPYTLYDVPVAEPERTMPDWLKEEYGTQHRSEGPE